MSDEPSARLVKSTLTSLRILEVVREQQNPRLTDIVDDLDIGYSTAHNHLETLREEKWLVRENGEYRLSMKFLHYGRLARRNLPFFQVVRRHANELANMTNLEVEFLVEEYGRIVSLIDIIPTNSVYGNIDDQWQGVGIFYNMTNTASGKAILAELPNDRVEAIIERRGFAAQTPYSVQDRDALYKQLESTRQQGYAKAHQEVHEGFENVATVVHHPDGSIFGAISIGWPSYIFEDRIDQLAIDQLIETKRELEAEITEISEE